jgi:prolipoprotein diacylglyceryl transferase
MGPDTLALGSYLPSPPSNGFHVGSAFIHFYGLMYVIGIALAIYITRRRVAAAGGNPALVYDVATWVVPAGIIGGRIYFDITTPFDIVPKHAWWAPLAVWDGGLGIWGGVIAGALVGVWRVRRAGQSVGVFLDAAAPALLVAQAIGRIGNYFNSELFGKPSSLPWALEISRAARLHSGMPAQYLKYGTFQPSFLYELIFDLALAAALAWLGHHRAIRPPGLFALYVAGYSAYRIFEETIRIDSSAYFLGLRLNFFVALVGTAAGLAWFAVTQHRGRAAANGAAALAIGGVIGLAAGCGQVGQVGQAGQVGHRAQATGPGHPALSASRQLLGPAASQDRRTRGL